MYRVKRTDNFLVDETERTTTNHQIYIWLIGKPLIVSVQQIIFTRIRPVKNMVWSFMQIWLGAKPFCFTKKKKRRFFLFVAENTYPILVWRISR